MRRQAIALLSLVGLLVAAYLYLYQTGRIGTLACGSGGCEAVQASRYSHFLGLEVSLIGLGGYAVLLVAALGGGSGPGAARLLALLGGIGVLFTAYLTWLELFVIHAVCRWCLGSAVIITAIFVLALLELRALRSGPAAP